MRALGRFARQIIPEPVVQRFRSWDEERSLPDKAKAERVADRSGVLFDDPGIEAAIDASLGWLKRAQDCSTSRDGGVARHVSFVDGWSSSYPETTGYIVPTFLACTDRDPDFSWRAQRMLDWLLTVQFDDGSFHGGTVEDKPCVPAIFNTGQILLGLAAGVDRFGAGSYGDAMHRAAVWLCDAQDDDGCWRRFPTPFAVTIERAYDTHAAWGLFEAARVASEPRFAIAGLKQVRWAMTRQRPNGWFEGCCLDDPSRPLTHTIGYALRGLLEAHRYAPADDLLHAAALAGAATRDCVDSDGRLPGRLDAAWRPAADWVCLTGSLQLAWCWFRLFELTGDSAFLTVARRVNAFVRRTVKLDGDPDFVGAVKGSFPVDGQYGRFQALNWAAKFFVDANLYEARLGSIR